MRVGTDAPRILDHRRRVTTAPNPATGIPLNSEPRLPFLTGIDLSHKIDPPGDFANVYKGSGPYIGKGGGPGSGFSGTGTANDTLVPYSHVHTKKLNSEENRDSQQATLDQNGRPTLLLDHYSTPNEDSSWAGPHLVSAGDSTAKWTHDVCSAGYGLETNFGDPDNDLEGSWYPGHKTFTAMYKTLNDVTALTSSSDTNVVYIAGDHESEFNDSGGGGNSSGAFAMWEAAGTDWEAEKTRLPATDKFKNCERMHIVSVTYNAGQTRTEITYKQCRYPGGRQWRTLASGGGSSAFTTANNTYIAPCMAGQGTRKYLNQLANTSKYCHLDANGKTYNQARSEHEDLMSYRDARGAILSPAPIYAKKTYDVSGAEPSGSYGGYSITGIGNNINRGWVNGVNEHLEGTKALMEAFRYRARRFAFTVSGTLNGPFIVGNAITFNNSYNATAEILEVSGNDLVCLLDWPDFYIDQHFPSNGDTATSGSTTATVGSFFKSNLPILQQGDGAVFFQEQDGKRISDGKEVENMGSGETVANSTTHHVESHAFLQQMMQNRDLSPCYCFNIALNKAKGPAYPAGVAGADIDNYDNAYGKFVICAMTDTVYCDSVASSSNPDLWMEYFSIVTNPDGYRDTAGDNTLYQYGDCIPVGASMQARIDNLRYSGGWVPDQHGDPEDIKQWAASDSDRLILSDSSRPNLIKEWNFETGTPDEFLGWSQRQVTPRSTMQKNVTPGSQRLEYIGIPSEQNYYGQWAITDAFLDPALHDNWDIYFEIEAQSTMVNQYRILTGSGSSSSNRNFKTSLSQYRSRQAYFFHNIQDSELTSTKKKQIAFEFAKFQGDNPDWYVYRAACYGSASFKPMFFVKEAARLIYVLNLNDTAYTFAPNQNFMSPGMQASHRLTTLGSRVTYNASNPAVIPPGGGGIFLREPTKFRMAA